MDPSTSPGRRHGEAYQPSGFSHAGALCYPSSPLPLRDRLAVGHAALDRGTEVRILVQQPTFCSGRDGDTGQSSSPTCCLLYTSDAADDLLCVDLGGRRIIKKKKKSKKNVRNQ